MKKPKTKQDITTKSVFTMCCKMKTCALWGKSIPPPARSQDTEERVKALNWYSLEMHAFQCVS